MRVPRHGQRRICPRRLPTVRPSNLDRRHVRKRGRKLIPQPVRRPVLLNNPELNSPGQSQRIRRHSRSQRRDRRSNPERNILLRRLIRRRGPRLILLQFTQQLSLPKGRPLDRRKNRLLDRPVNRLRRKKKNILT
jgi:hypothetical protein